jgi:molybdate transport system substrate-binding protein
LLIRLKLSKMPALARRFMDYVASSEGQAVFRKHGFLDNKMNGTR